MPKPEPDLRTYERDDVPARRPKRIRDIHSTPLASHGEDVRGLRWFMNLPIEVFAMIVDQTTPSDLIVLTRSNKLFRNILLQRSSITVWRQAEKNVPGLPSCPAGLCEPQYAVLMFFKECTLCGALATSKPDPFLLARICFSCLRTKILDTSHQLLALDPKFGLYPYSPAINPRPHSFASGHKVSYHSLKAVVEAVNDTYDRLEKIGDEEGLCKWVNDKLDEMKIRSRDVSGLEMYIEWVERSRVRDEHVVRHDRRQAILEHLYALGWTDDDMRLSGSRARTWNSLMEIPKQLTTRSWKVIRPQLVALLEAEKAEARRGAWLNA